MKKITKLAIFLLALPAFAENTPSNLKFGAMADVYYQYNLNNPGMSTVNNPGGAPFRLFDNVHNQIQLNLIQLSVSRSGSEVGFNLDLDYGNSAEQLSSDSLKNVGQANITFTPNQLKGLHFKAGKMTSHMGYEGYRAADNWNYSRTYMFDFGTPNWHTGASAGFDILPNQVILEVFYYNRWNSITKKPGARDTIGETGSPTIGARLGLPNLGRDFDVTVNVITGPSTDNVKKDHLFNLFATYKLNPEVHFAVDGIYGIGDKNVGNTPITDKGVYWGAAAYAKADVFAKTYVAARFEFFEDKDSFRMGTSTLGPSIKSGTLTGNYALTSELDLRAEARHDYANKDIYSKGGSPTAYRKSATTGSLALLLRL